MVDYDAPTDWKVVRRSCANYLGCLFVVGILSVIVIVGLVML